MNPETITITLTPEQREAAVDHLSILLTMVKVAASSISEDNLDMVVFAGSMGLSALSDLLGISPEEVIAAADARKKSQITPEMRAEVGAKIALIKAKHDL